MPNIKPVYGKYREEFDSRTQVLNLLRPYAVYKSQLYGKHNPSKKGVPMGFGRQTKDSEHIVKYYVGMDKSKLFKYRGRLYDASRMPASVRNKIAKLM